MNRVLARRGAREYTKRELSEKELGQVRGGLRTVTQDTDTYMFTGGGNDVTSDGDCDWNCP